MPFLPFTFSVVGVQKAGTSTLQWMLNQHPEVARPPRKEMGWFDVDEATWLDVDHSTYGIRHAHPIHRALGDVTPRYLLMPGALERMRLQSPEHSLIAIFRDPIDRLVSQWVTVRARHHDRAPDWPEMMAWRPEDFPIEMPEQFEGAGGRARFLRASGVIRGYYGGQIRHGLSLFPRDQWLFLDFAELLAEPVKTLDAVTRHIEVGKFKPYPPLKKPTPGSPTITGTAPTGEDLVTLARVLEPELAEYVALTGRSVDHWTTERLLNGELDADEQAAAYARKAGLVPE